MAWLYKQRNSNKWWLGYRLNGQQHLRSTGTADRKEAERELAKLNAMDQAHKAGRLTEEFCRLLIRKESASDSLRGYVGQWLHECKDLSPVTQQRYREVIEELCKHLNADQETPLLRDIQPDTLAGFLRQKRAATSSATTRLCRRILAVFFNYAVDNRVLQVSPVPSAKSLRLTKDSAVVRRAFTLNELKILFLKAPNDFWRYMLLAGFYCGQRMGDLITLPWGAVDFDRRQIHMFTSKTGRALIIPLRAELGIFLLKIRRQVGDAKASDPIWPEQAQRYATHGSGQFSNEFYDEVLLPAGLVPPRSKHGKQIKAGEKRTRARKLNAVSFHCLRHTFVSLLKTTGGSQAVAKELAGHSSDAVSDLYTHIPEEVLAKAIEQLPELIESTREESVSS